MPDNIAIVLCCIGIAIGKCQGHKISMTSKATMVINIDANLNKSTQQRAGNDPGVAAILKSFGISKVEDYVYQDRKKLKSLYHT